MTRGPNGVDGLPELWFVLQYPRHPRPPLRSGGSYAGRHALSGRVHEFTSRIARVRLVLSSPEDT